MRSLRAALPPPAAPLLLGVALLAAAGTPVRAQSTLGPAGGPEGAPFQDACEIGEIRVRAGWWIDGVQLVCRNGRALPSRGGTGGDAASFRLQPGEQIRAISGSTHGEHGAYVYSLRFHTDRRTSPLYGNAGSSQGLQPFRFEVPAGARLAGLTGRAGEFLNAIGILLAEPAQPPRPAGPIHPPPRPNPPTYYALVQTGDRSGAGTDANVYVTVRGTEGESPEVLLDKPGYDDFESGDRDVYDLGRLGIGEVVAVTVRNDGAGAGADWYLEWVCVQATTGGAPDRNCSSGTLIRFDQWVRGSAATLWTSP